MRVMCEEKTNELGVQLCFRVNGYHYCGQFLGVKAPLTLPVLRQFTKEYIVEGQFDEFMTPDFVPESIDDMDLAITDGDKVRHYYINPEEFWPSYKYLNNDTPFIAFD